MSDYFKQMYQCSLYFLEGTKESFDRGLDMVMEESKVDFIAYYTVSFNEDNFADIQKFSAVFRDNELGKCFDSEFTFLSNDLFEKLKKCLLAEKTALKKIDKFPILKKYINSEYLCFIPCFVNSKLSGIVVGTCKSNGREIEVLSSASNLISKAYLNLKKITDAIIEELKCKTILDNIEDGYFEIDLKGNLIKFNDAVCRISGLSREELMGLNNRDYTSAKTSKNMQRVFNEIYRTSIPLKIKDYEILFKGGNNKWLELSASLIKDEKDEKIGFRGFVRDVTARKKGEDERKKLEEKLNHAQRLEAIGTLAGGIAHDFNNLLMAVQGNASLLLKDCEKDSKIFKRIRNIENCVESGANLTRQLLGFARGGKYLVKACNINRVIEASLILFSRTYKELLIETNFDEKIYSIEADPSQLEQVLINLYLNAVDATEGRGIIKISTFNRQLSDDFTSFYEARPGDYIEICVTDTGIGMDECVSRRVFEPFFTTKEKGRGTGLGLASVFGIIRNHNGFIKVESSKGKGSSFRVYLPAAKKSPCDAIDSFHSHTNIPASLCKILLVDDEESILEVGAEMLSEVGYSVETASSGHEAVSIFRENKDAFNIVILDMIMPDLDGYSTYLELKKINNDVKVLFASGYIDGDNHKIGNLKEASSDHAFISKPYNLSILKEKISYLAD